MNSELRPIQVVKNYLPHAEGSCLFSMGKTKVLCVASIEEKRPPHAEAQEIGWLSAEYSMLPRAANQRTPRGKASSGGRSQEISRLIGRALRAAVDLKKIGPRSILIDCDVICADGGTRTASINGGMIALAFALKQLWRKKIISEWPLKELVAAVSVGMVKGKPSLDIDFEQDQIADSDFNFVMTEQGKFVEVQGTAEHAPFSKKEFIQLADLARRGIHKILKIQKRVIGKQP